MSSTRAALNEARVGLIAARQERPPAFAHAVRLYKGDLFFQSLLDLTVVGMLVIAAVTDWREAGKMAGSALGALQAPLNTPAQKDTQNSIQRLSDRNGPGSDVIAAIGPPMIEREALRLAGATLADRLDKVATAVERGGASEAAQLVSVLDDRDPTVAYAKAVVALHQEAPGSITEARRLLRRATEQAVYPAFVLSGEVLFRLAQLDGRGQLPASERVGIDDTGQTHPATRAELAAEAVLWWERAAAFSRPQGLRLLGMARARGLSGKVDYVGAAALWREAAERGDAISQLELGKMLMFGHGLQPNSGEAIRMFRLAADRLPVAAIGLATALISNSIAGDAASAREAIELLEAVLDKTKKTDELAFAYQMLGQYYFQAAPTQLRNIPRALKAWERSVKNGMRESSWYAGEAYRAGTGIARDLPCAYGFYLKAKSLDAKKVDPILAELEQKIGEQGIERGKRISFALTPYPSLGVRFAPVNTRLGADQPKPAPAKESASLADPTVCTQITDGSPTKSFDEVMSILNKGRK